VNHQFGGTRLMIVAIAISPRKSYSEAIMSNNSAAVVFGTFLSLTTMCSVSRAEDKPAVEASYFLGESKMSTPDGKLVRTSLSLVKRLVNQSDSRIEEHVLSINEKDVKAFVVVLEVKGKKFTVTERSNSFTGEGELVGDAWKWKEWKSVTKLTGGAGTVTSEDKLTDQGLSAKKSYAGADGKVILLFEEALKPISPKTYDILYSKLAPAEKK